LAIGRFLVISVCDIIIEGGDATWPGGGSYLSFYFLQIVPHYRQWTLPSSSLLIHYSLSYAFFWYYIYIYIYNNLLTQITAFKHCKPHGTPYGHAQLKLVILFSVSFYMARWWLSRSRNM
jgi:hypothetical protein